MEIKKKKPFPKITKALKEQLLVITDCDNSETITPALTKSTQKIVINCFDGSIVDIVPTLRFK